jgi:hypothetical protein
MSSSAMTHIAETLTTRLQVLARLLEVAEAQLRTGTTRSSDAARSGTQRSLFHLAVIGVPVVGVYSCLSNPPSNV